MASPLSEHEPSSSHLLTSKDGDDAFPPTQWSIVARAILDGTDEGRDALEVICQSYWLPLYVFARKKGHSAEDAEDLTQGFLAHVIARKSLANVDPEKGRLRAYLQAAMSYYMTDQWRKETSVSRGSGTAIVKGLSIDQAEQILAQDSAYLNQSESPDQTFDRQWALTLLDRVLARLEEHYQMKGELHVLQQIRPFLEGSRHHDESYESCAQQLGLSTNVVRVRATRMRQRFKKLLLNEVSTTVPTSEVEDELRFLFSVFEKRASG